MLGAAGGGGEIKNLCVIIITGRGRGGGEGLGRSGHFCREGTLYKKTKISFYSLEGAFRDFLLF